MNHAYRKMLSLVLPDFSSDTKAPPRLWVYLFWPVLTTALLSASNVDVGFFSWDDFVQISTLENHHPTNARPFDLWRFYEGIPDDWRRLSFAGMVAWWRDMEVW